MLSEREERLVVAIQGLVKDFTSGNIYQPMHPYGRPSVKKALEAVKDIAGLPCEYLDVFKGDPFPMEVQGEFRRNPGDDKCPKCGGLLTYSSPDYEGDTYFQDVGCQDCDYEFTDSYPYSHSAILGDHDAGDNEK